MHDKNQTERQHNESNSTTKQNRYLHTTRDPARDKARSPLRTMNGPPGPGCPKGGANPKAGGCCPKGGGCCKRHNQTRGQTSGGGSDMREWAPRQRLRRHHPMAVERGLKIFTGIILMQPQNRRFKPTVSKSNYRPGIDDRFLAIHHYTLNTRLIFAPRKASNITKKT